ncbi:MAG: DUF445 family protein [Epsilonproteobacteria bacterium]|nr:DUF445 family protein [Campylobacterota bacterium]
MKFDKAFFTNLIAFLLVVASFFVPPVYRDYLYYTGLFALSGAITNQLAIHMLFEKVPFLYGSGIIALKFEDFKRSIKNLIMEQFFTKEQLDDFFKKEESNIDLSSIIEQTDFTPAYEALKQSVMESSFGGMLNMFGGEKALEPLKDSFVKKLKSSVVSITKSEAFNQVLQNSLTNSNVSEDLIKKIEKIVDKRLDELTPDMVKEIIKNMIKEHLSWLVLWGGVFGGLLGLLSTSLQNLNIW